MADSENKELLSGKAKQQVNEAWQKKLDEAKENIRAELREEYAQRFEVEKEALISATEKMVHESIEKELNEFMEDKKALAESRVKHEKQIKNTIKKIHEANINALKGEITELRVDRKTQNVALESIQKLAVKTLTKEISELREDRQSFVEKKVKLVQEAEKAIAEAKKDFIKRATVVSESLIESTLRNHMKQFEEEIKEARRADFGRRLFEQFESEFLALFFKRDPEMKKLVTAITEREEKLAESKVELEKAQNLVKEEQKKARIYESRLTRERKLNELLKHLGKNQRSVMESLLESVKTQDLDSAYKKHIPYVLNEQSKVDSTKSVLNEGDGQNRPQKTVALDGSTKQKTNENNEFTRMLELARWGNK